MNTLKTAEVIFNDEKYNYKTSVNGQLSDNEIISYFEGKLFNFGRMVYDHTTQKESETTDFQRCIKCNILN